MSAYENTRIAARVAVVRDQSLPLGLLQRAAVVLAAWRKRARIRAELARLDNAALGDVGIDRAIVDLEVKRSFWQKPIAEWRHQARGRHCDRWE